MDDLDGVDRGVQPLAALKPEILSYLCLAAAFAACAYAMVLLVGHPLPGAFEALRPLIVPVAAAGLAVAAISFWKPRAALPLLAGCMTVPLLALGFLSLLATVAVQWAAILSIGLLFFPASGSPLRALLRQIIFGYVAYSFCLMLLVYSGLFTPWCLAALHVLPIGAAAVRSRFRLASVRSAADALLGRSATGSAVLFVCAAVLIVLSALAAMPENGSDAIAAYRPMLIELMHTGRLTTDPSVTSIGLLSLPPIWAQAASVTLSQDLAAAKIWNYSVFCAAFGLCVALAALATRPASGKSGHGASLLVTLGPAAFICSTPIVARLTLSAFPDMAAFLSIVILAFWIWDTVENFDAGEGGSMASSILSGMILAFCFLTKYLSAPTLMIAVICVGACLLARSPSSRTAGYILRSAFFTAALVLPWLLYVYLLSGNPFFPFYNEIFNSPYFGVLETPHTGYISPLLPWDMTVSTKAYSVSGGVDGGLGLTFLFGFVVCIYLLIRGVVLRDLPLSSLVSAVCFIGAVYFTSILQNGDRYIFPATALLVVPLATAVAGGPPRPWAIVTCLVCLANLSLLPRLGYGAGDVDVAYMAFSRHDEAYRSRLDRQRLADDLTRRYGADGRVLDLTGSIRPQTHLLSTGWYTGPVTQQVLDHLRRGPAGVEELIDRYNVDAVVVNAKSNKYLEFAGGQDNGFAVLKRLAGEVSENGDYTVLHMKDEVRFDGFQTVAPAEGKSISARLDAGVYAWSIKYRCTGSGTFVMVKVVDGKWVGRRQFYPLCTGAEEELATPLFAAGDGETSLVVLYQFGSLDILQSGVWHRK